MSLDHRLQILSDDERHEAAGRRLLDAPDMDVPDPQELRAELDAVRGRHA
jgi:hypothetical protein